MATPAKVEEIKVVVAPFKGRGIVKTVLSGDSLVVTEDKPSSQGPPAEKVLTLSSLSAPRLARGGDKDEPFAWESREFVRKAAVGKKIFFTVDYTHPNSGREYCTVFLPNAAGNEPGENLNSLIVSEGWATVFNKNQSAKKGDTKENLLQLEETAIQAGKGVHTKDKAKAEERPVDTDAESLLKQLKGKTLNAVVEQVRTGSSVRVTVLPSRHTFQILLSGVQAPGWKKDAGSAEPQPEPYAREAKYFVEQGVLQRDVQLTIEGLAPASAGTQDKTPSFSGSIEYQNRDVAEELLKAGLARYVAYSAAQRGQPWVQKLKAAEKTAKDAKRRLFTKYEPSAEVNGDKGLQKEFSGKVVSILNSGSLFVIPDGGSTEVQVNLSSIRLPRPGFPGDEEADAREPDKKKVEQDRLERALAAEGKELLRKRLIGQKVRVVFDYVRKKKEGDEKQLPEKAFYTVYQNDANLAVVLVESGYAWVMSARQGEEFSMDYEVLVMAESKAKAAHRGAHAPADKLPTRRVNDLCVDSDDPKQRTNQINRTKQFLSGFTLAGVMKGVVDHVFSGARFKISVPKQSAVFMFTLGGIRVPKRGESQENDDLSNQAMMFSREKLNQYDVSLEVESLDKGGNFVGTLYTQSKKNFAVALLEVGLASVHLASAQKLKDGKDLIAAEESAKQKKLGLWKNWDEEEEKRKVAAAAEHEASAGSTKSGGSQSFEVVVTEVIDGARFFVQIVGAEAAGLDELVLSLTQLSTSEGSAVAPFTPKVDELVRGQFSEDDRWYRAKVLEIEGGKYKLQYIDYGNCELVPATRIRQLPNNFRALPPQAQEAALAFIKPLKEDSEFFKDAQQSLKELAGGKKLSANIEYKDPAILFLSLNEREPPAYDVTVEMVRQGLARLGRSRRRNQSHPVFQKLRDEEDKAKSKRTGIWYHGDIADSDEDEGPSIRPPAKGGKQPAAAAAAGKEAPKKK